MTASRHDRLLDQLEEYACGYLAPHERDEIDRHVATCAECARRLRELTAIADDLARTVEPMQPSPELKQRVLATLADLSQEPPAVAPHPVPRSTTSRAQPLLAAAAVALVVLGALLYSAVQRERDAAARLAEARAGQAGLQARLDAVRDQADRVTAILTADDMRPIPLAAPPGQAAAVARAYWSPTQGLLLVADDLPEPPPGRVYQVWIIGGAGSAPVSAGLLGDLRPRRGMLLVPPPDPVSGTANVTVAVTDEPPGGLDAPSGAMRLIGS
jgi:anti-sigma-K factor RskA